MKLLVARCCLFLDELSLHSLRKIAITAAGGDVMLVGIAMRVLPGPPIVILSAGVGDSGEGVFLGDPIDLSKYLDGNQMVRPS